MQINKSTVKQILSMVLSLILALFSIIGIVVFTANITLANPGYMKGRAQTSHFASKAKQELEEIYTSYGAASGFTIDAFADILNEDEIETALFKNIEKIYFDTPAIDYDALNKRIYETLMENVETRGIIITEDIKIGVAQLAAACATDYIDAVSLPFVSYITSIVNALREKLKGINIALIAAFVFTAAFLIVLNKTSHRLFKYYAYSFITSFIMSAILPAAVILSDKMSYISVRPISLNHFAVAYLNGIFKVMINCSYICLAAALLCIAAYYALRKANSKRAKHKG
ncbi:MAG: hypothetical protein RR087_05615 [Oscillospiraceae bacterium]